VNFYPFRFFPKLIWCKKFIWFVGCWYPWFMRSGSWCNGVGTSVFVFNTASGVFASYISFRDGYTMASLVQNKLKI
jgi:hypothetical protein